MGYFRKQDVSKETIHEVWVYLVGLRQAEKKVWVLYKKEGSEIQTSDKATMKIPSSGERRMLAPKLPQACRVICQGEEAGEAG